MTGDEQSFDAALRAAGLTLAPDDRAAALEAARRLRAQAERVKASLDKR